MFANDHRSLIVLLTLVKTQSSRSITNIELLLLKISPFKYRMVLISFPLGEKNFTLVWSKGLIFWLLLPYPSFPWCDVLHSIFLFQLESSFSSLLLLRNAHPQLFKKQAAFNYKLVVIVPRHLTKIPFFYELDGIRTALEGSFSF